VGKIAWHFVTTKPARGGTTVGAPTPAEAIVILPGFALAWAMKAGTVAAGNNGLTSIKKGLMAMLAIGVVSRTKLKLRCS